MGGVKEGSHSLMPPKFLGDNTNEGNSNFQSSVGKSACHNNEIFKSSEEKERGMSIDSIHNLGN